MDADARADIGPILVYLAGRAAFADVDQRIASGRHAHAVRPMQIVPLGFELAVAVKYLHPVVLAIGYIEPTIGVAADIVRDVELARIGARLAPGHDQLAVGRVFVDAG